MDFPVMRMRRLRRTEALRSLVRETRLHPGALIYPLFICPGEGIRREISSMPGVYNLSLDEALKESEACAALGLGGLLLFGLPAEKDDSATGAWAADGIVQTALRSIKRNRALDSLVTIADVCLCEYTSHGHCGVVARDGEEFRRGERRERGAACEDGGESGAGWSGCGCAQRHDGWAGGGHTRSPGTPLAGRTRR